MMNILITDDHPVVLAGIRQIVETALPESRIRQAATADEALAIIEAGMVDILIADLELNGESGIRQRESAVPNLRYRRYQIADIITEPLTTYQQKFFRKNIYHSVIRFL